MLTLSVIKRVDRISAIAKRAPDAVSEILARNAGNAASIAYQLAPVSENNKPGHVHMRDTIAVIVEGALRYSVGVGAIWAKFVEFGTENMLAQPFLTPAVEAVQPQIRAELKALESQLK